MLFEDALAGLVTKLEQDRALLEPRNLRGRFEALDRLDAHLLEGQRMEPGLSRRAEEIRAELELVDRKLYGDIRCDIQRGAGRARLLEWRPGAGDAANRANGRGYDHLDELCSGILQLEEPSGELRAQESDMVAYQPTPARHIFDLIDKAELKVGDCLMDLGSGLGQVTLLAAICSGANCIGVELEPAYVDCARKGARSLNLNSAKFVQSDVRETDLSEGTIFYLYTPFRGAILREVLHRLRQEATQRKIRICTFGPCTQVVAEEPWLGAGSILDGDRVVVFHART